MSTTKKLLSLLIATLAFISITNAQGPVSGSISGKLIDELTDEPVSEANIRILSQKDSVFVTGKASDKDGSFSIPLQNGDYIVHVSYIGYAEIFKDTTVTSRTPNVRLGTIALRDDNLLLADAIVTAKAPEIVV